MVNFILIDENKTEELENVISFSQFSMHPGNSAYMNNKNEGTIIKWDRGNVEYEKKIDIPDHKILTFWDLMDELNVWKWKSHYSHPEYEILDGHEWQLELYNKNVKTLETAGSSYYPKNFKKLKKHLNYLFSTNIL